VTTPTRGSGGCSYLDSTAEQMLRELHDELSDRGVTLAFARVKWRIRKVFDSAGLTEVVGAEHFFPSVRAGVKAFGELSSRG